MRYTTLTYSFLMTILAFTVATPTAKAHDDEIQTIIREYILENGDVVMEAVERYQKREQEEQFQKSAEKLEELMPKLTSADAPSVGNADAPITIVEFFDYNCGYCKRAVPDIQKVLKKHDDVRFVFREMPILGPPSVKAAEWAMAAHKQGKYFDYHVALMQHQGGKDEKTLSNLAKSVGLDVEQMKKDANSDAVKKMIEEDIGISQEIGIRGTPAFVIDGVLHRGYLGPEGLQAEIEKARSKEG